MQETGIVISVDVDVQIPKKNGGTYPGTQLIYKNKKGEIKNKAFHSNVLKFNEELKKALDNLGPGEHFIMTQEKEGEFWNVKSLVKIDGSQVASNNTTNIKGGVMDDNRQALIVRQNVLGHAVNILTKNEKVIRIEDVISIANKLEQFVFTGKIISIEEDVNV